MKRKKRKKKYKEKNQKERKKEEQLTNKIKQVQNNKGDISKKKLNTCS